MTKDTNLSADILQNFAWQILKRLDVAFLMRSLCVILTATVLNYFID